jgi:hypothetical protein
LSGDLWIALPVRKQVRGLSISSFPHPGEQRS